MNIYFRHVGNRGELEVVGDFDDFTEYATTVYNLFNALYKDNKLATLAGLNAFIDDCKKDSEEGEK